MGEITEIVERLRESAAAFRKYPIHTADGDPVLLTVQADELDEAATALLSLQGELEEVKRALDDLDAPTHEGPDQGDDGPLVKLSPAGRVYAVGARLAASILEKLEGGSAVANSTGEEPDGSFTGEAQRKSEGLRRALAVFAAIKPSDLYPADGSEAEPYVIMLHNPKMLGHGAAPDFTGADLAAARAALAPTPGAALGSCDARHADSPEWVDVSAERVDSTAIRTGAV